MCECAVVAEHPCVIVELTAIFNREVKTFTFMSQFIKAAGQLCGKQQHLLTFMDLEKSVTGPFLKALISDVRSEETIICIHQLSYFHMEKAESAARIMFFDHCFDFACAVSIAV